MLDVLASGDPRAIDARDERHMSAVAIAAYAGRADLVERLLRAGAAHDAYDAMRAQRSTKGWASLERWKSLPEGAPAQPAGRATLLHLACAGAGSPEVIGVLVAAGVPVDGRDRFGCTALQLVVSRHSPLAAISALLDAGADPNARDRAGYAALDRATDLGVLNLLLSRGASPDGGLPMRWPRGGDTVIEARARFGKGNAEIDVLLRAGAQPQRHPRALSIAAQVGNLELVRTLFGHGFARRVAAEGDGMMAEYDALFSAASEAHTAIVEALLEATDDVAEYERALAAVVAGARPDPIDRSRRIALFDALLPRARSVTAAAAAAACHEDPIWLERIHSHRETLLNGQNVPPIQSAASKPAAAWPAIAARAHHEKFGAGTITKIEGRGDGAKLAVRFDDGTSRTVLIRFLKPC